MCETENTENWFVLFILFIPKTDHDTTSHLCLIKLALEDLFILSNGMEMVWTSKLKGYGPVNIIVGWKLEELQSDFFCFNFINVRIIPQKSTYFTITLSEPWDIRIQTNGRERDPCYVLPKTQKNWTYQWIMIQQ